MRETNYLKLKCAEIDDDIVDTLTDKYGGNFDKIDKTSNNLKNYIDDMNDVIARKSDVGHSHAEFKELQEEIDKKADADHTHPNLSFAVTYGTFSGSDSKVNYSAGSSGAWHKISLNFKPSAVFVQCDYSHNRSGYGSEWMHSGFAISTADCGMIKLEDDGFSVRNGAVQGGQVLLNEWGFSYKYLAFK